MATTTITTPNAPDLLTLVTDTESIVSSIDTLTSYLDSELLKNILIAPSHSAPGLMGDRYEIYKAYAYYIYLAQRSSI